MRQRSPRRLASAVLAAVALSSGACEVADTPPDATASPTPVDPARAAAPPEPRQEELVAAVGLLGASVEAAIAELQTILDTDDPAVADEAAARAVAQLTASEDLADEIDDLAAPPLLPGQTISRQETIDYGDSFTTTLTASRNAGDGGSALLGLLRDAVAGDLGVWQRDPAGVLDQIDDASRTRGDVEAVEAAVIELAGEGSRALAYALRAERSEGEDRRAYAERAIAHLDIITSAIDELDLGDPAPAPTED